MISSRTASIPTGILIVSLAANGLFAYAYFHRDIQPEIRTQVVDAPLVMRTKGGLLEVSTVKATEQFETTKDHKLLGVPIAKTIARIRVPAVYRYHIELAPEWKIIHRDNRFFVVTPPVKPSLPVAIDTGKLEKESLGAWSYFTEGAVLEPLQRSITQSLAGKSISPRYIELQRETARKTVSEFIEKWLVTQAQWKDVSVTQIKVFFADEPIQALGGMPVTVAGAR